MRYTLIFVMILLSVSLIVTGCTKKGKTDTQMEASNDTSVSIAGDTMQKDTGNMEGDKMEKNDAMENTSMMYTVESATTASYTVDKQWLQKDAEMVTGTTSNVTGTVMYDHENQMLKDITVEIDSSTFNSGSGGRDREVAKLLNGGITIANADDIQINAGTFSKTIPLDVTINGVTKTVDFTVQGDASESMLKADGTASFNMSDFNIEAPNALNIYTVADEMTVSFNLEAQNS